MRIGKQLFDLEIDEVSVVDRPANQHGLVAIAKRAEENGMPLYDADGYQVDETDLQVGDLVYGEDGTEYAYIDPAEADQYAADDDDDGYDYEDADDDEPVLAGVGKGIGDYARAGHSAAVSVGRDVSRLARDPANRRSAARYGAAGGASGAVGYGAGRRRGKKVGMAKRAGGRQPVRKSLGQQVFEELSKAYGDDERHTMIAKAFDMAEAATAEARVARQQIAKMQEEREFDQYAQLADQYDLPVDPYELGGVLQALSKSLDPEQLDLVDRIFAAQGSGAMFEELGSSGSNPGGVWDQVSALAGEAVGKGDLDLSPESAIAAIFDANPAAYDEYLREG